MYIIDRHAYTNAIRHADPAPKAGIAILVIMLCLLLDNPWVSLMALSWVVLLSVGMAHLSVRLVLGILAAQALFLLLTSVGILISVSLHAPPPAHGSLQLGPLWLATSPASVVQTISTVLHALAAASAMNFLALTTPLIDLIALLRRLRMPLLIIDLMTLMYRFIFTLLERVRRIFLAQDSRLGYSSSRRMLQSAAQLGSVLFVDVYRRTERLQIALDSRGYQGELRVLSTVYRPDSRWRWIVPAVAATLLLTSLVAGMRVL